MLWLVVWNIFYFFHMLGIVIPTDFYFFSEGLKPAGLWWICPQLDGLASASLVGGAAFVRMLAPALCFFCVFGWAHGRKGLRLCWRKRLLNPPPISIWSGQDHDRPWFPQNVPLKPTTQPINQQLRRFRFRWVSTWITIPVRPWSTARCGRILCSSCPWPACWKRITLWSERSSKRFWRRDQKGRFKSENKKMVWVQIGKQHV